MPDLTESPTRRPGRRIRSILLTSTVALTAVAGYGGFRLAAQIDLGAETGAGLVVLAVITGFAVFFSPCSFPLLVAILARPVGASHSTQRRRTSLTPALAMGTGAALFLLIVGAVVGLVGEGIAQAVGFSTVPGRVLRATVAAIVLTAGLVQLGVIQVPLWRVTRLAAPLETQRAAISDRHQHAAHVLYGFGFVLAGFG